MRKIEFVHAPPAHDAALLDGRRDAQVDAEGVDDRKRVIRQKLATEFVSRERVTIDDRQAVATAGQKSGESRSGRAAADDRDIYFHKSSPKRNGQARTASTRLARTRFAISRASD